MDGSLMALDQFISEVRLIPMCSEEDRLRLAALARQGDDQARHELVQSLVPILVKYARRCVAWCKHLTLLDLVQVGVEVLLRRFDHALEHSCPHAVLLKFAYWDMREWCHQHDPLVSTPLIADAYLCFSLDVPVDDKKMTTYADILPALPEEGVSSAQDHQGLYEALSQLSEGQRFLLARRYGLLGYAPMARCDLAREMFPDLSNRQAQAIVANREQRALSALQVLLSDSYLQEARVMPQEYYTAVEMRERYGIKRSQLRSWTEQGLLLRYPAPPEVSGNVRYVYAKGEVDALLQQRGLFCRAA